MPVGPRAVAREIVRNAVNAGLRGLHGERPAPPAETRRFAGLSNAGALSAEAAARRDPHRIRFDNELSEADLPEVFPPVRWKPAHHEHSVPCGVATGEAGPQGLSGPDGCGSADPQLRASSDAQSHAPKLLPAGVHQPIVRRGTTVDFPGHAIGEPARPRSRKRSAKCPKVSHAKKSNRALRRSTPQFRAYKPFRGITQSNFFLWRNQPRSESASDRHFF